MLTEQLAAIIALWLWLRFRFSGISHRRYGRRKDDPVPFGEAAKNGRRQRKPDWVMQETIRLKALHPDDGCRKIAEHFNRLHASHHDMTVSKSWVVGIFRKHECEIRTLRQRIKHRKGKPGERNRVWGLDLTGKTDDAGHLHMILGVLDHGSRANLALQVLKQKISIAILRIILDTVEKYGSPRFIRTDNERVFTSRLFRFGLRWLGIKHQTTDLHCPWMNGRIERFFLTLKQKLDRWEIPDFESLARSLYEFQIWYNAVRPHQSLYGRTPAEIWNVTDVFSRKSRKRVWFEAWDGLLAGYYLPP